MYIVWTVLLILFVVAEAATAQLVSIWFVAGALAAIIAVALKAPLWLQIVVFIAVSIATVIGTRPLVKKLTKTKDTSLNADRLIGKSAPVKEKIDNLNGTGCIEIDGIAWTARSEDGSLIEENSVVEIIRIEGVKAIVRQKAGD